MVLNFKTLRTRGRRSLKFRGECSFAKMTEQEVRESDGIPAFTRSRGQGGPHEVRWSSAVTEVDILHELCHVTLNESGFLNVEAQANEKLDAFEQPVVVDDRRNAIWYIAEGYADWLLYTNFDRDSKLRRDTFVARFTDSDGIENLYTRGGFWGIAAIPYVRFSFERANKEFPAEGVSNAVKIAPDGPSISALLEKLDSRFNSLPDLAVDGVLQSIDSDAASAIANTVVGLVKEKLTFTSGVVAR